MQKFSGQDRISFDRKFYWEIGNAYSEILLSRKYQERIDFRTVSKSPVISTEDKSAQISK